MSTTKTTMRALILLMLGIAILGMMMGCSDQSFMSVSENVSLPPPPLTAENIAAGPAPGYHYLPVDVTQIYNGMITDRPMYTQQLVRAGVGGAVYFPSAFALPGSPEYMTWWHGVRIGPEALSEDVLVTMLVPDPDYAVVDYGPHPYDFESDVQIELSYKCANLIEIGVEPEELVIMYWNDVIGEYELVPTYLNARESKLYGSTDHFSRYIIATRGD